MKEYYDEYKNIISIDYKRYHNKRFIDAFCARTPKSVLAKHYTDYSPERLKRIYDRANLKVLSS